MLDPRIKKAADQIYESDRKKFQRLVVWIKAAERTYDAAVIAKALEDFAPRAAHIELWWPYLDRLLDIEEGKHNASHEKEKNDRDKHEPVAGKVAELLQAIAAKKS